MSAEQQHKEDIDRLQKAADSLGEHFDTVQIFTTRHESGVADGTMNATWGVGNWFTRFGQVREWLIKSEERTRQEVRNRD